MSAPAALLARADEGDTRSIARLLTIVENDEPGASEILRAIYPRTGRARIVGVTGPPGGGKSTLVSRLAGAYRETHPRVAVVAVDPSSPFSGGAILGDRIRMRERFLDEGLFIRSMASRGHAGGLSRATMRVINVLDALGVAVVIVETVGVGQEEVDVVRVADTVCLVTVPGLGDDIQAIKAGILEIADVLVVNKADRPGADEAARDLAQMLSFGSSVRRPAAVPAADGSHADESHTAAPAAEPRAAAPSPAPSPAWKPPIVRTSATENTGVAELMDAIDRHDAWARQSGEHDRRRADAARSEVESLLQQALIRRLEDRIGPGRLDEAVARVARRDQDPYAAVEELLR